jgi:hypothetical protein
VKIWRPQVFRIIDSILLLKRKRLAFGRKLPLAGGWQRFLGVDTGFRPGRSGAGQKYRKINGFVVNYS